jgi:hypothetical protein
LNHGDIVPSKPANLLWSSDGLPGTILQPTILFSLKIPSITQADTPGFKGAITYCHRCNMAYLLGRHRSILLWYLRSTFLCHLIVQCVQEETWWSWQPVCDKSSHEGPAMLRMKQHEPRIRC